MRENLFQVFCILGVAMGFGVGFLLKATTHTTKELTDWIIIPGEILISLLKMFAVSLIVTSVIAGVTGLDTSMSRKTAIITGSFVCVSNLIVIILGMVLALTLEPGVGDHHEHGKEDVPIFVFHLIFQDLVRNAVPESFFQAFYERYKTQIIQTEKTPGLFLDPTLNDTETKLVGNYVEGPNMIGLVIWSFVIGIMLNKTGEEARNTVEAIQCLNNAIQVIINWILWYMPIGVVFLIAEHVLKVSNLDEVRKLAKFVGVVCAGLAVQTFVIFPVLYIILTRRNPFLIFKQVSKALTTAFIIASSAAALPLTLQCCEENVMVDKKLCHLMLPIITSINRTGMVLYEVVATIFVAQLHDINLEVAQMITLGLSTAFVAFGSTGIPATGAVTTILILTTVGLPAEDAAMLVGVEWILDHFITVVNVLVNVFGLAITNHVWQKDLKSLDKTPRDTEPRTIKDIELDLSFLESDEDLIPSVSASPTRSISPRRGHHRNVVTPTN